VFDGAGDGFAAATVSGGRILAQLQNGYVQMYLSVFLAVMAALAAWLLGSGRLP
jgi:hypothetical protein